MQAPINTAYKGKIITFVEVKEKWLCGELGLEATTLGALKQAIDRLGKKARGMKVPAIYLYEPRWQEFVALAKVEITLLHEDDRHATIRHLETAKARRGDRTEFRKGDTDKVSISELYPMDQEAARARQERAFRSPEGLLRDDTPAEQDAELAEWLTDKIQARVEAALRAKGLPTDYKPLRGRDKHG